MKQRKITESEVELCIQNFQSSYPDGNGNTIYRLDINARKIKVVANQKEDIFVIITVAD